MTQPTIMLVDDDKDILEIGAEILRDAGYAVTAVANGDIALVILEQGLPYRVLVTDVVLPGVLDGYALARKARELNSTVAVVYSTGFAEVARIRARGAPFGEILTKPWTSHELVKVVASVAGCQISA